jgi:hypothetical protein
MRKTSSVGEWGGFFYTSSTLLSKHFFRFVVSRCPVRKLPERWSVTL